MGNSDKTDKPAEDQIEADAPKVEDIEDAEIIEEIEADSDEGDADAPEAAEVDSVEDDRADDAELTESAETAEAVEESVEDSAEPVIEQPSVPSPEPAAPVPAPEPARSGGGFMPLLLGGIVAGGIGFGVAYYLGDQLGFGAKTEESLAAMRQQIAAQNTLIETLQSGQDAVSAVAGGAEQAAAANASGVASVTEMAAALGARVDGLSEQISTFESRLTDIEKRPLNEGLSAAAIAAYEREVEDLKELVAAQKEEAAELKDKADLSAKAALARSAVTRIVAALDSGAGYRAAVVDYGSATGDTVPEVLNSYADEGVITLAALVEAYPDAARAALAKARVDKVDEDSGNKLGNFLKNQLGARSVEPKEGTGTDAILSRAEAALREGRLNDVMSELDALAEGPKSVMAEWRSTAETRLAATLAAEELAQRLNTN